MKRKSSESDPEKPTTSGLTGNPNQTHSSAGMAHEKSQKRVGKRPGRKPSKIDQKAKLERSRQSARECRARKKLRYQYLEELVSSREKAVFSLREEVEMYKRWSVDLDRGIIPDGLLKLLAQEEMQRPLALHCSPPSHSTTPTASPSSSSVDAEHMAAVQPGGRAPSGASAQRAQFPGQMGQRQEEQSRRQALIRQPHVDQSEQHLAAMNKGSRSFEESPRSSSSSTMASSIYRSESVPNLTVATAAAAASQHGAYPEPGGSTTLVYKDFGGEDSATTTLRSTGFLPELTMLSKAMGDADTASNIPTVVSHQSPPSVTRKSGAAWSWEPHQRVGGSEVSQGRTYPFTTATSASSVVPTPQSAQLTSAARTDEALSSPSSLSPAPNFVVSSRSSVSTGSVASPPVPYYQRPRSSSDLARKVTSSAVSSTSSLSLSQQNIPGLFDPVVTTFSSQEVYPTLVNSVATCLTNSTVLQDTAPVCMGSELSASISEPIPHWYSFLDDLESVASLSARQGAFSDAGTPGSSRARSGAGTPSSVDSPYSQQLLQQQQPQQQQQQDSGSDGNIPHIISDLLGQPPSS